MLQTLINTLLVFNRSRGTPCIRKISIPQENESIHIFLHKNVTDTCININHLSLRTYKTCNNQKCIVAFNNCQSNGRKWFMIYNNIQLNTRHYPVTSYAKLNLD